MTAIPDQKPPPDTWQPISDAVKRIVAQARQKMLAGGQQ